MITSDGIFLISSSNPLYLKVNKNQEYIEEQDNNRNVCYKGNYKNIMSSISDSQITGDELDPYLISKEEWDKAVEETYKGYKQIIEL